jgi:hypothetical protein
MIPLLLAVGRVAASGAVRGAATRAVASRTGKSIGSKFLEDKAISLVSKKVKGATTAPSGTVPGVLRKTGKSKGDVSQKKSNIFQSSGRNQNSNLKMSNGQNAYAASNGKDSCCNQSVELLRQIKQNTEHANDNDPTSKCCAVSNEFLGSIDDTLKKILAIQQQGANAAREQDAEAVNQEAPGLGGLKEMAKEKGGNLFGFLLKTAAMIFVTNLKPIAKAIGDATKAFTDTVGNLVNDAGKLWDSTVKDVGNWWTKTNSDIGNWWNKTSKDIGNWWDSLWGGDKEKDKESPVTPVLPPAPATTPPTSAAKAAEVPKPISSMSNAPSALAAAPTTASSFSSLISKAESGPAGYNAYNQPQKPSAIIKGPIGLTRMTLDQVMSRQNAKQLFAVGKYQIIPSTLKEAKEKMGLTGKELFDEKLQERIFKEYLAGSKRPALSAYLSGESNDIMAAMIDAAKEWRGLPDPRTGKTYADKGAVGNKANVSVEELRAALEADRARNLAAASRPVPAPQSTKPVQQNNNTVIQASGGQKPPTETAFVPPPDGNNWLRSAEQFSLQG